MSRHSRREGSDTFKDCTCLLYAAGIMEAFSALRNLGQLGSIPKKLVPVYKEMVASNPAKRPNAGDKVESLRRGGGFFKNELIDTLVFLEELHLKV